MQIMKCSQLREETVCVTEGISALQNTCYRPATETTLKAPATGESVLCIGHYQTTCYMGHYVIEGRGHFQTICYMGHYVIWGRGHFQTTCYLHVDLMLTSIGSGVLNFRPRSRCKCKILILRFRRIQDVKLTNTFLHIYIFT